MRTPVVQGWPCGPKHIQVCDLFYANLNEISNVIGNLHYFAISIAIVNDIRKLNAF
jgi:hypothetical protein